MKKYTPSTHHKQGFYAWWNDQAKCYKICHILENKNPTMYIIFLSPLCNRKFHAQEIIYHNCPVQLVFKPIIHKKKVGHGQQWPTPSHNNYTRIISWRAEVYKYYNNLVYLLVSKVMKLGWQIWLRSKCRTLQIAYFTDVVVWSYDTELHRSCDRITWQEI